MDEKAYKFLLDMAIIIPTVIVGGIFSLIYFLSTFIIPVYVIVMIYYMIKIIFSF